MATDVEDINDAFEQYVDRLGLYLEHTGFTDDQIDAYFLEHHGVRGMKWGVRRRGRLQRTAEVGKGKRGAVRKARVYSKTNPLDLVRTGSFKKSAARKSGRQMAREDRMASGHSKARDILVSIGTSRITDIVPTIGKGAKSEPKHGAVPKISSGKAFAVALPLAAIAIGSRVAKRAG